MISSVQDVILALGFFVPFLFFVVILIRGSRTPPPPEDDGDRNGSGPSHR